MLGHGEQKKSAGGQKDFGASTSRSTQEARGRRSFLGAGSSHSRKRKVGEVDSFSSRGGLSPADGHPAGMVEGLAEDLSAKFMPDRQQYQPVR
jgi:hypothetical protein